MPAQELTTIPVGGPVGALLRHWRDLRRKSQLELSLDMGVSQRHLSFIEVGRSAPSRKMLVDIATALDMPLRDRNTLLMAGGYAPLYHDGPWDGPEMQSITKAVERMLRQHEPFPALVMDRYWNVLMTNRSAPRLFSRFTDLSARKAPRNMLHLVFDPNGLRPHVADWPTVAESLIQRVHNEAVGRIIDDKLKDLLTALMAYPDVEPSWVSAKTTNLRRATPIIPSLERGERYVVLRCSIRSRRPSRLFCCR